MTPAFRLYLSFVCVLFLLFLFQRSEQSATGQPSYYSTFQTTYSSSPLASGSQCNVCHVSAGGGGARNTYGSQWDSSDRSFTSINGNDADADGFTNLTEINAGSFPGNPSSVPNTAPTANAGPDQNVFKSQLVTLNGSLSSDPEGTTVTYVWSPASGSGFSLSSTTTQQPTFTPTVAGAYVFQLIVSDGSLSSSADNVTINVSNRAPVARAGSDTSLLKKNRASLSGATSSDSDGDPLVFTWSKISGPDVTLVSATSSTPSCTPVVSGTFVFQLIVNDGTESSPSDSVNVTTTNRRPLANAGLDSTGFTSDSITLSGALSGDSDADTLTYAWSQTSGTTVTLQNATSVTPVFTALAADTYVFSLSVHDGEETSLIADTIKVIVALKTPAVIISVTTPDTRSIRVSFDWKLQESSAEGIHNFNVRRISDSAIFTVTASVLQSDSQTVKLTVDTLALGTQYIVTSSGVYNEVNLGQTTSLTFHARKIGDFGRAASTLPDSTVNFEDILIFAIAFGSNYTSSNWNPTCDLSSDTPSVGRDDAKDLIQFLPLVK